MGSGRVEAINVLRSQGYKHGYVEDAISALQASKSMVDLVRQFNVRHWNCGEEQFLLPLFRPLYLHMPEVRQIAVKTLGDAGFPEEVTEEFIVNSGNDPSLLFRLKYEDRFSSEAHETLRSISNTLMFDTLREKLCPPELTTSV